MSVANPWIDASPDPLTSHSLAGFPGFRFSQTIGFTVDPQLLCAWIAPPRPSSAAAAMIARTPSLSFMVVVSDERGLELVGRTEHARAGPRPRGRAGVSVVAVNP